jgi:hypothetical protein
MEAQIVAQYDTLYTAAINPAITMPMPSPSTLRRMAAPGDELAAAAEEDVGDPPELALAAVFFVVVVVPLVNVVVALPDVVVALPDVELAPLVDAVPVDDEAEADAAQVAV